MMELVDQHLIDRLSRIQFGGKPIAVYGPAQGRPAKKVEFRCLSLSYYLDPIEDAELARPYLDKFVPSDQQSTVTFPYQSAFCKQSPDGADIVSVGPESWTVRKYPTPVKMFYQLDIIGTSEADIIGLTRMLFRALPMPYSGLIGEIWFHMRPEGHPIRLDELEKPLFRSTRRYIVTNVWEEREDLRTTPSITQFDPQLEITN